MSTGSAGQGIQRFQKQREQFNERVLRLLVLFYPQGKNEIYHFSIPILLLVRMNQK